MIKDYSSLLTIVENISATITEGIFILPYRSGKILLNSAEMVSSAAQKLLFGGIPSNNTTPEYWPIFVQNPHLIDEIADNISGHKSYELKCVFWKGKKRVNVQVNCYQSEENNVIFCIKELKNTVTEENNKDNYRLIFDNAAYGQLIAKSDMTIEAINKTAIQTIEKYFNLKSETYHNLSIFEKHKGYDVFAEWFRQALSGVITQKEVRLDLSQQKRIWLKFRIAPIYDENKHIRSVIITGSDITARKESERRLEENEEKLKAIFESSYDALIMVGDGLKMILDCNQRAIKMFERDIKGLSINTLSEKLCLKKYQNEIKKALSDTDVFLQELEFEAASGRKFWGSTAVSSISIGHNKFKLIRITDITEQKQMEADLLEAKEKALALSQVKDQFLASMSHEIRTPLNGVIGAINLLDSNHALNPAQYNRTVKTLRFSAQHLLMLINDILDFNKIESDKIILDTHNFNFNSLLREIAQTFTFRAQEKNILLFTSFDTNIPKNLVGDSLRIVQVISNLVNNAIKFTPQGTVRICTRLQSETPENVCIKVEISDTGIGIASHNLEKIFDVFTQAESHTSRRFGGTGLGLAIVKRLLKLMNSEIKVESVENEGSIFYFELTLAKSTENYISDNNIFNEKHSSFAPLTDVRLLVAEDNEINRYVICNFLSEWSVQYDIAIDGQEVLNLLEKNSYNMILMDLQMPVIDGIEASRRIRATESIKKETPIIALTAATLPNTTNYLKNNGINDYLAKPFDAHQLYNLIYKWAQTTNNQTKKTINYTSPMPLDSTHIQVDFNKMLFACKGNLEEETKCLDMYLYYFNELLNNFEQAVRANDTAKLSNWIHNIKPIMSIAGINDDNLCAELLKQSRSLANQPEFDEAQFAPLRQQLEGLCNHIVEQLKKRKEQILS